MTTMTLDLTNALSGLFAITLGLLVASAAGIVVDALHVVPAIQDRVLARTRRLQHA